MFFQKREGVVIRVTKHLKVWFHSHKNHKPYFSTGDMTTINQLMRPKDTIVSICTGNGETIGRIDSVLGEGLKLI